MTHMPVSSSTINSVGYDPESRTMHVEFNSGKTYEYSDVAPETHQALVNAPSVGAHFGKHIRELRGKKAVITWGEEFAEAAFACRECGSPLDGVYDCACGFPIHRVSGGSAGRPETTAASAADASIHASAECGRETDYPESEAA